MTSHPSRMLPGGAAAVAGTFAPDAPAASTAPLPYFAPHPFIEQNPKAVFVRRTHVAAQDGRGRQALRRPAAVAADFRAQRPTPAFPSATASSSSPMPPASLPAGARRRELGHRHRSAILRRPGPGHEAAWPHPVHFHRLHFLRPWNLRGLLDINERLGITTQDPERRPRHLREGWEITWSEVPEGVVFKRIPHYAPVNEPATWLFNLAKWKGHSMGLTLCTKNEQGLVVHPFTQFCGGWPSILQQEIVKPEVNPRVEALVNASFERHLKLGYSRYDTGGSHANGANIRPIEQEIWAQKTADNMSTLHTGFAMIEGIYGRDGDGFYVGDDYLTNLVMFGMNKFRVDVVGLWLGGHEPGNLHLYRILKERGLTDTFSPWEIPVYEWTDDGPVARKLTDFPAPRSGPSTSRARASQRSTCSTSRSITTATRRKPVEQLRDPAFRSASRNAGADAWKATGEVGAVLFRRRQAELQTRFLVQALGQVPIH